jgi:hypothetical protein
MTVSKNDKKASGSKKYRCGSAEKKGCVTKPSTARAEHWQKVTLKWANEYFTQNFRHHH